MHELISTSKKKGKKITQAGNEWSNNLTKSSQASKTPPPYWNNRCSCFVYYRKFRLCIFCLPGSFNLIYLNHLKKIVTSVVSHWDFFHGNFGLLFPAKSQLQQSCATQPTVHAWCCSVSIIHRTPTCAISPLTCARVLMNAIAHGGVRTHVRESAKKVDPGRKIQCDRGGIEAASAACAGPALYQLSYIPTFSNIRTSAP